MSNPFDLLRYAPEGHPRLSWDQTLAVATCAGRAGIGLLLWGAPGIGKTALFTSVAALLNKPCLIVLGSTLDPTDFGILYVNPDTGTVDRVLFDELARACDEPCVVFFDELTTAQPATQAPMLSVIQDRRVAGRDFHPETIVVACANPPEQAPGGVALSAPMRNRWLHAEFAPHPTDVDRFFLWDAARLEAELTDDAAPAPIPLPDIDWDPDHDPRWAYATLLRTWVACRDHQADLLVQQPPDACVDGDQQTWASQRAWHRTLAALAQWPGWSNPRDPIARMLVAAGVGQAAADTFFGYWELLDKLPSTEDILRDPTGAEVPSDRHLVAASMTRVPELARQDVCAAILYYARFPSEAQSAAYVGLRTRCGKLASSKSPHAAAAKRAWAQIMGTTNARIQSGGARARDRVKRTAGRRAGSAS